jgi:hypothetical protein
LNQWFGGVSISHGGDYANVAPFERCAYRNNTSAPNSTGNNIGFGV